MLQTGITKYFSVKRAGDDGHTPLPRIGKRNRSGSQELPGNTGNETTPPSENPSQYSDKSLSSGPQPPYPPAKRMKAEIEPLSMAENVDARPTSSLCVGEASSDASQPTYPPTPPMQPDLETSFIAEHGEARLMPSLFVDEASSGASQPTPQPTPQIQPNLETSSAAERGEARPISSLSVDEASSGASQSTNSPTMQMTADTEPSSTREPVETRPVSRKRSRSPSPSKGQPSPVNIRKVLVPLPPTKRAKLQSGEAIPTQPPAYGETLPNPDSQTRYGVPTHRQKHRVPKETLMLLIRKSRHSASEAMPETQSPLESFPAPDDSISRHNNSAELGNTNRAIASTPSSTPSPLADQASGNDLSPAILAPGVNDSINPLHSLGPPFPLPSGTAVPEVVLVGPHGVPSEKPALSAPSTLSTNATIPAAALPSRSVGPSALHDGLKTGVAHPLMARTHAQALPLMDVSPSVPHAAVTMGGVHPHPASVFRGNSSMLLGFPPSAQDARATASPAQPSAHPISPPPSPIVSSIQVPASAAMMDSALVPSPSRTVDPSRPLSDIQTSHMPSSAHPTGSSTNTAQDATATTQLSLHPIPSPPSADSPSPSCSTAATQSIPAPAPSKASGPSMTSSAHLTTTGLSMNTAQDARVAALPSQPSAGRAPLPCSTIASAMQGPTISETMHSAPVPSSSRTASPLSALSSIQASHSVPVASSPSLGVAPSAHLTITGRSTNLDHVPTPAQPLPLHSTLSHPPEKGKSVVKPSVRFQMSSDGLAIINAASGSTHSSNDHVDEHHHCADDDVDMADLTQDGDEGMADPSDKQDINDALNADQHREKSVAKLDMLQVYEYLKSNPDAACTNKSIAAIFEAFVGMKEDIKSVLHAEAAAPVPARQYKRRGKKPIRETFDVEHHDAEGLDLLRDVRMFAKELLKLPEDPLQVPTADELRAFAKKVEGAVGPSSNRFILDLASKGVSSPWNLSAISIFADEFVKSQQYPCTDKECISIAFKTHLTTLKTHYWDQENAAAMDDRARIEELDKSKRNAHYQRRSNKRHRRRDSLRAYQHVEGVPSLTSKLQRIPVDAMSEEEVEHDGENTYWVASDCAWRSSEMKDLWDVLDALDLSMHFQTNERPTRGRFPYHRVPSHRVGALPAPSRLPANLYSEEYKASLSAAQLAALDMQPSFKFVFPVELLRVAEKYRRAVSRDIAPLPNSHPRLSLYTTPGTSLLP